MRQSVGMEAVQSHIISLPVKSLLCVYVCVCVCVCFLCVCVHVYNNLRDIKTLTIVEVVCKTKLSRPR